MTVESSTNCSLFHLRCFVPLGSVGFTKHIQYFGTQYFLSLPPFHLLSSSSLWLPFLSPVLPVDVVLLSLSIMLMQNVFRTFNSDIFFATLYNGYIVNKYSTGYSGSIFKYPASSS